jgi:hypothetical protein
MTIWNEKPECAVCHTTNGLRSVPIEHGIMCADCVDHVYEARNKLVPWLSVRPNRREVIANQGWSFNLDDSLFIEAVHDVQVMKGICPQCGKCHP